MQKKVQTILNKITLATLFLLTIALTMFGSIKLHEHKMRLNYEQNRKDFEKQITNEDNKFKTWTQSKVYDNLYHRDKISISVANKEYSFKNSLKFNGSCSWLNIELDSSGEQNTNISLGVGDGYIISEIEFKLGNYEATRVKNINDFSCSNSMLDIDCSIQFPYEQDVLINAIENSDELVAKITAKNCADDSIIVVQHEYNVKGLKYIDQEIKSKAIQYMEENKKKKQFIKAIYN